MSGDVPPRPSQVRKEKKRLLHRKPGFAVPDKDGRADYTEELSKAVPNEPEAVDAETATRFAEEGERRFNALRTREIRSREHRTVQNHLREFCTLAARLDADPDELSQIRELIAAGRKRLLADAGPVG